MSLSNVRLRKISKSFGLTIVVLIKKETKNPSKPIFFLKPRSNSSNTAEKQMWKTKTVRCKE